MSLKIVSWNINSVRLRMPLVEILIEKHHPDIICLQEIKCAEDQFPSKAFKKLGYNHFALSGQKGYHGVATISKFPIVRQNKMSFCPKEEARHIYSKIEGFSSSKLKSLSIHNFYVPAGGDIPDLVKNSKFAHKFEFLENMENYFKTAGNHRTDPTILVGDLNIAPLENDVWSHKQMIKVVSHTPEEVEKLQKVQSANNWIDEMREHVSADEKLYSWWSYRAKDWKSSNRGRRLDHIWLNQKLANHCAQIDVLSDARGWEKPSDHVPVIAHLKI